MSFKVDWKSLNKDLIKKKTYELLTNALNSGKKPTILTSSIKVKDLNFGEIPPNFEILEIGELENDKLRCMFKINYIGDFHLTLSTKVQANPLKIYQSKSLNQEMGDLSFIIPNFLLSNVLFALPLDLKISQIKMNGIGVFVLSKTKGLTLIFRNDPIDSIRVSSSFDNIKFLADYLQLEIEKKIRELFRETISNIIHEKSIKYLSINKEFNSSTLNISEDEKKIHENDTNFDLNKTKHNLYYNLNTYSSKKLLKNLQLFCFRETFILEIPKFQNILQRSSLNTFHKNQPNLLSFLTTRLSNKYVPLINAVKNTMNNALPINIFLNNDFNKTKIILNELSLIQKENYIKIINEKKKNVSTYFYDKNNVYINNRNLPLRLKRRTIKVYNYINNEKKNNVVDNCNKKNLTSQLDVSIPKFSCKKKKIKNNQQIFTNEFYTKFNPLHSVNTKEEKNEDSFKKDRLSTNKQLLPHKNIVLANDFYSLFLQKFFPIGSIGLNGFFFTFKNYETLNSPQYLNFEEKS